MNDRDDLEAIKSRIVAAVASWRVAASLTSIRESFDALFADGSETLGEAIHIGPMAAAWITPPGSCTDRVVLFCHGGGFQVGSLRSHSSLMVRLARASDARVLGFNYRLAPEHKYPAAAEDAISAYLWLLGQGLPSSRIVVAGDSAGAALAMNIALRARDMSLPLPSGLALISPWLDLTMRGASYASRAALDVFSKPAQLAAMARAYLGRNGNVSAPSASPVDADLAGLPPILIHAGDHDITLDDAFLLAARARQSGVDVKVRVWDHMFHHFQMFGELRQSHESLTELGRFVIERTSGR
ncbi:MULTISPECIES: alpha/beta hydrolase [Bradyrhizobium]|uniref:alpha/beta hydrolase n=1 Tax=Bradyrhizobium elkanii TaxID=29448 RepID=UPI0003F567A1|nr:alpha/beta hydrolase [Bradyrhizobium elkanii]